MASPRLVVSSGLFSARLGPARGLPTNDDEAQDGALAGEMSDAAQGNPRH